MSKKKMKIVLKKIINIFGYKIAKLSKYPLQNDSVYLAIKNNFEEENAVFFDIGVNQGQTSKKMKSAFPQSIVYGFEPNKICFNYLTENVKIDKVFFYNKAVGSSHSFLEFNEYSWSAISSLLKRAYTSSKIMETYKVEVITIDDFCKKNKISHINLLKTDTEGYELEVLKGATTMMDQNQIQFVLVETFFNENFIGQGSFGDIYNYLLSKNFGLVRFYDFETTLEGMANRSDALFFNKKFKNIV